MSGPGIVILANHQHAGLAAALRALAPAADITSFDLAELARDSVARRQAIDAAAAASHIIGHDTPAAFGPLATTALRAARRPLVLLPGIRFAGFHPDVVSLALDSRALAGPTGLLHSRIAVAAFLAGLPVAETAALYNSLVFARLDYFTVFAAERERLLRTFAIYGFDIAGRFDAWTQPGCFMFDPTRPRMRVLLDIGRLLCARIGLAVNDGASEASVANPLATAPMQPLFSEIAARLGIRAEGSFRGASPPGVRPTLLNLDSFLTASFEAYRRVPLATLRAADAVAAALPKLLLREADFGRSAAASRAAAAAPDDAVFLSWHGQLLGIETATGLLVQNSPWPAQRDSTPAAATLRLPLTEATTIALAGGTEVAPAARGGGAVTLSQQKRFLAAPPRLLAPRFAAATATDNELFLPLRRGELALLRDLAAGNWTIQGHRSGATIAGYAMVLQAGLRLEAGELHIGLATDRLSRRDGGTICVELASGETITLVPARHAGSETVIATPADLENLPAATSLEQFRAAPGFRLHLHGTPELIHLPLTIDHAARHWLLDAYRDTTPPRLGRHAFRATAVRATDKYVLLNRGAEGVIFDANGICAGRGGRAVLPGADAAKHAVRLQTPVCVFYNANLHEPEHWLAGAAVVLHILQQVLPPDTSLLLPARLAGLRDTGGFDHMAVLASLGFGGLTMLRTAAPMVHASDVMWLEHDDVAGLPAALLQSFRARAHALYPPPAQRRMVYLKSASGAQIAVPASVEALLQSRGFETIDLASLAMADQIKLFASAAFVVAPQGPALAGLLFCQPGTRVLELAPDVAFNPLHWQISEKLGLHHAVLPSEPIVDATRFRTIFKMLRLTSM